MRRNLFIALLPIISITLVNPFLNATELPEGFQVHFNNAAYSQSNGIDMALVAFIESAETSVAAAFYSIGRVVVADALIDAAHRLGFDNVRVITDANYRHYSACKRIENAGLHIIDETCDGWSPDSVHVHHKFCVVDGEKVWTGSYNITDSCTIYNNNNAVSIECLSLAEAYLTEFNEMWGGESGPPANCAFSTNKNTVIDHHHVCSGVPVDVYFSPTRNPFPYTAYDAFMNRMDDTQESIHFCIYTFTQTNLAGKLIQKKNAGLHVQGVMDEFQSKSPYSVYNYLVDNNVDVILNKQVTPHANLLHHKFAVFDYDLSTAGVVTGSYNWTMAAQNSNDENSLFIHNQAIAAAFYREFHRNYYGFSPGDDDPVIQIRVNEPVYVPGSFFHCSAVLTNPGYASVSLYEYIILDIGDAFGPDRFYFWPSWSREIDNTFIVLGAKSTVNQSILQFIVPMDMPSFGPVTIWAGMLDTAGSLVGTIDSAEFTFR